MINGMGLLAFPFFFDPRKKIGDAQTEAASAALVGKEAIVEGINHDKSLHYFIVMNDGHTLHTRLRSFFFMMND